MRYILPAKNFSTAQGNGVYLGTPDVVYFFSGSPIELFVFDLRHDWPKWEIVDPRCVAIDYRKLRLQSLTAQRRLRPAYCSLALPNDPRRRSGRRKHRSQRLVRDIRALRRMTEHRWFRLASRFPSNAQPFLLLWLAHRIPEFAQLLVDAPMLAVMVAIGHPSTVQPSTIEELLSMVRTSSLMPRQSIVANHSFPLEAAKGLCKVTPAAADPAYLPFLRETLRDRGTRKQFQHTSAVGPDLIRIFSSEQLLRRVSDRFLRLLAEYDVSSSRAYFAPMLEAASGLIELGDTKMQEKVFTSPQKLVEWYGSASSYVGIDDVRRLFCREFPVAPFRGERGLIEQIRTGRQLLREALMQNICVARVEEYTRRMADRECYLFSVDGSMGLERCTLQIEVEQNSENGTQSYCVVDVVGKANAPVSRRTLDSLRVWAEDQGVMMTMVLDTCHLCQLLLPGFDGQ